MNVHPTHRWRGIVGVALVVAAVGVLSRRADVFLLSTVAIVYAVYPWVLPTPDPDLRVERRVSDRAPSPGDRVEVTSTVHNDGEEVLLDCRVVDGVPPALSVVEGSPRRGAVLRPGAAVDVSYVVTAQRGTHSFEPVTVVVRDLAGAREVETTVDTDARTTIRCLNAVDDPPVRSEALRFVGRIAGHRGGGGTEFHSLREYQVGDPLNRIAWAEYARTGHPATVDFRQEHTTTVVLLIDARPSAYCGRSEGSHAVALSTAAAERLAAGLTNDGVRVGVATVGRGVCWLGPGTGRTHRTRIQTLLAADPVLSVRAPTLGDCPPVDGQCRRLRKLIPTAAQVVFLSPLSDSGATTVVDGLDPTGRAVTVVSPDVTVDTSPGCRLAAVERTNRITRLRARGVPVVDWPADEPLSVTLARRDAVGVTL